MLRVTIAAYNCGLWAYYHFSKGHDVDQVTTGQDYSRDVLAKAVRFKPLLPTENVSFRQACVTTANSPCYVC